jgi:hypothetical protein
LLCGGGGGWRLLKLHRKKLALYKCHSDKIIKIRIHKTALYLFLYGVKLVLSPYVGTLRGVFENRVLRKIFGPKIEEATGG